MIVRKKNGPACTKKRPVFPWGLNSGLFFTLLFLPSFLFALCSKKDPYKVHPRVPACGAQWQSQAGPLALQFLHHYEIFELDMAHRACGVVDFVV